MRKKLHKVTAYFCLQDLPSGEKPHVEMIDVGNQEVGIVVVQLRQMVQILLHLHSDCIIIFPRSSIKMLQVLLDSLSPGHARDQKVPYQGVGVGSQRVLEELEDLVEDEEPLGPDGVITDGDPELGVHQGVANVVDVLGGFPQSDTEQFLTTFFIII